MKNVIALYTISLFIFIFLSCNNKKGEKQKENKQPATEDSEFTKLKHNESERIRFWKAAIDSGDFRAYNKVAIVCLLSYREVDVYYYSLIMANKYHCPEAYYNMWVVLTHQASAGEMVLLSNDADTKNLSLYYLFRANELGFTQAKFDIEVEFGKGKSLPSSSFFLKKLMHP